MQDHCGHAPHQKHVAPARRRCGRTLVGAVLACAVALLLLPLGSASAQPAGEGAADSAASAEKRVVRVGFPVQPGLTEIAEDGTRSGYTYDYLQEVAQYTGWEFEYVDYEGTDDEQISAALDDLMAGRIDVLGAMSYSKDLEELFDYPVHSYGHTYTVLFAPIGEDRISASTIDRINPLRVATWKNSVFRLADFESYASLVNLSYELVPCEGGLEVFETLQEGKADVGLGVGVSVPDGFRTVLRFTPRPFYFATSKASGLVDDLDLVLGRIEQSEPTFASDLFSHYFPEDGSMLEFSDTERTCIENAGTLRVGLFPNRAPMSYVRPRHRGTRGRHRRHARPHRGHDGPLLRVRGARRWQDGQGADSRAGLGRGGRNRPFAGLCEGQWPVVDHALLVSALHDRVQRLAFLRGSARGHGSWPCPTSAKPSSRSRGTA